MKQFKIRASGSASIMGGTIGLTAVQTRDRDKLIQRDFDSKQMESKVKPLTENMQKDLDKLNYIEKNPVLPQGARTYCENWVKEQLYSRRKEIQTKYMDKGNINEDESLDFVAEFLGLGMLIKNEKDFTEDEFMTGTPDAITKDFVIDVKNSWDCFTFPLFSDTVDNAAYYWQAQVYMYLTGVHDYRLIYTLTDTPIHLIEREANSWAYNNGYGEPDDDLYAKYINKMTYQTIPDNLKIKIHKIAYNPKDIDRLVERVKYCREYINELLTKIK